MPLEDFSDDVLDDLTDNALQELERNAVQLTQAKSPEHTTYLDYGWEHEDDDLDTTEVTNDLGPIGRPVLDSTLLQQHTKQHVQQHAQQPQMLPSETRRRLPAAASSANARWASAVDTLSTTARLPTRSRPPLFDSTSRPFATSQHFQSQVLGQHNNVFTRPSQAPSQDIVSALQRRLRCLEAELNASRGENAIIRSNLSKARTDHEAQIARLKADKADAMAEKQRIAEAALEAERTANTELQFMQRDLREVNDRARRKDAAVRPSSGVTTPRKTKKTWDLADGFDHMDIAVSPTKGMGRNRGSGPVAFNVGERTPTKGKRKRPRVDSPVAELDIDTDEFVMSPDIVMSLDKPALAAAQVQNIVVSHTAPFDFLQLALDHGAFHGQAPTFETLSRFAFPSDPTSTSLASMIFEKLPLMGHRNRPMQLLVDFTEHAISLWTRCVQEEFWEPIKYLVTLVSFPFDLHATSVAPHVVASLVPVAQLTVRILAEGRHRLSDGKLANSDDEYRLAEQRLAEHRLIEQHIDSRRVLDLLLTAATACATVPSETPHGFRYTAVKFWRLMSRDIVFLLLTQKQKLGDIVAMLDLLALSPLPDSIGPVSAESDPAVVARDAIERVSVKLAEPTRSSTTGRQGRKLRLAALRTLVAFARYPFGALQLASHDNALPRLVTCLSSGIDHLYHVRGWSSSSSNATVSADLCRIISQSLLLIHTLVTGAATANAADIGQKLSMTDGGSQQYLLALGRLTFADEDHAIEAGIGSDVVEAAHELLELAVTPDEGETVSEAFATTS